MRHVHSSLRATAETYGTQVLGIEPDDLMFSAAKLFFAYGLGNSMTFPMAVGAASVLLPDRPTPDAVLATMRRYRPTIFAGVPTLYAALLAHPEIGQGAGSDRLRRCISAGEPLPEHIGAALARAGRRATSSTGSARPRCCTSFCRTGPTTSAMAPPGSRCRATRCRIVDESGRPVADGEPGELIVSGPSAAEGYWNQREKSRRTFRGEWTHTGDTYTRDADGYYRYNGRSDDMLKVGGIWVSPFEVEEALIGHTAVLEAAVVGQPDEDRLIKPKAFVVLQEAARGEDPAALTLACRSTSNSGSACGNTRAGSSSATPAENRDREDPALQIARRTRRGIARTPIGAAEGSRWRKQPNRFALYYRPGARGFPVSSARNARQAGGQPAMKTRAVALQMPSFRLASTKSSIFPIRSQ